MSAFVVIAGAAEEEVASRMIARDRERAPDGTRIVTTDSITFAHALLALAPGESHDQPLAHGQLTLVADARIDERDPGLTDAQQIAAAYERHGVECVAQLIGDFAFVLWDAAKRRLLAARDHLGVKPLYYAVAGERLILASSLSTMLLHPGISHELDEGAIATFLLGGTADYPVGTFYRQIKRLPPAHTLLWSSGRIEIRRYWSLPLDGQIRYRTDREYIDHFLHVFDRAVTDRTRGDRTAALMSGGLDSTAIAATARVLRDAPLDAFTTNYSAFFEDAEADVAARAASMRGMRHHVVQGEQAKLFDDASTFTRAEPLEDPLAAIFVGIARDAAKGSRTLLSGLGGDLVLYHSHGHLRGLLRRGRIATFASDIASYWHRTHRLPPLNLRAAVKQRLGFRPPQPPFPRWIRDDVARRFDLRDLFVSQVQTSEAHPVRPEAHRLLLQPLWPRFFETWDPGETGIPIELAYPLLDRRLIELLFAFPPMPWFANKYLLRAAMQGRLPDDVRWRPKTPLAGDPLEIAIRDSGGMLAELFAAVPEIGGFIDVPLLLEEIGHDDCAEAPVAHALGLAKWWRHRRV